MTHPHFSLMEFNTMKKVLFSCFFMLTGLMAHADRAPRGIWQTLTLADGSTIRAELCGDESVHYWQTADNKLYMKQAGKCVEVTAREIAEVERVNRTRFAGTESDRRKLRGLRGDVKPVIGHKKGLIILVEFTDKKFSMDDPKAFYQRMANEEGYNEGKQKGSLHDYFKDQSNGQFVIDFDVVGPIKLGQPYAYYGGDDPTHGQDYHAIDMICQAVIAADSEVNMKDYDWDGDGAVEQVYVLYAGEGQASGGGDDTVWPHKSAIHYYGYSGMKPLVVDGVEVDIYACSNEMRGKSVCGIGTICHEFSHCLGFPDMYDTTINSGSQKPNYGMGTWDLMNSGNHNNSGYTPAGYTSWEKMMAGWIQPIELTRDLSVKGMKPMSQHGDAYIIYNPANKDEYYMLENRKKEGWDAALGGEGMLILHVDYDFNIFTKHNKPNTFIDGVNDHQRMTIFHADGRDGVDDEAGDPYPYGNNNSLSNFTAPAATLYNKNVDGSLFMNVKISKIAKDENGYVSFVFGDPAKADEAVLFAESFDECVGTGANDGSWLTMKVAVGAFTPDNANWVGDYMRGASHCARFGSSASNASATMPEVEVDGPCTLTFRAAPFATEGSMTLTVSDENGKLSFDNTKFQLTEKQWTDITVKTTGTGKARIKFAADCRLYLDEVMLVDDNKASGIEDLTISPSSKDNAIYNLQGQKLMAPPTRGIYIRNGKKVWVK